MAEYIKRDALLEARELAICAYENARIFNADAIRNHLKPLLDAVVDTPAADVADVVHGRWIYIGKCGEYECSVCHGIDTDCSDYYSSHVVTEQDYCPYCGSRMDGDDDE